MTASPLDARRLLEALALLDRLAVTGGLRERIALSAQLDAWLPADEPAPAGAGFSAGCRLGPLEGDEGPELWLLPEARLGQVPGGQVWELVDAPVEPSRLAALLRARLLNDYLAAQDLRGQSGRSLDRSVAELSGLAWKVDGRSRGLVLAFLAREMGPSWEASAARLKTGFERALGERDDETRAIAAAALVRMAAYGPLPPFVAERPARVLDILFAVPRADVRSAALRALSALPEDRLAPLAEDLAPAIRACLADEDAEVARLAGALELRIEGGQAAAAAARELGAEEPERRARALRAFAADPRALAPLVPQVLAALADPVAWVRGAAVEATEPLLRAEDGRLRERAALALLGAEDPACVRRGVRATAEDPPGLSEALAVAGLRHALEGPEETREEAAGALLLRVAAAPREDALEAYAVILRQPDPVVRRAGLRALARAGAERTGVREGVTPQLVELLFGDPVPQLRVEAASTVLAMGHPAGAHLVSQLALDPDPIAREGAVALLERQGDEARAATARAWAADVGLLFDLASSGEGDARIRWSGALERTRDMEGPKRVELLVLLAKEIPVGSRDPFHAFAAEEVLAALAEIAGEGTGPGVPALARRLLETPLPRPELAARLAGTVAHRDAEALDLLWTMFAGSAGLAQEAARKALSELQGRALSEASRERLESQFGRERDPARRAVIRTLLGYTPR